MQWPSVPSPKWSFFWIKTFPLHFCNSTPVEVCDDGIKKICLVENSFTCKLACICMYSLVMNDEPFPLHVTSLKNYIILLAEAIGALILSSVHIYMSICIFDIRIMYTNRE